jgi:hypothetical protein
MAGSNSRTLSALFMQMRSALFGVFGAFGVFGVCGWKVKCVFGAF